jgi:hypothetical protein
LSPIAALSVALAALACLASASWAARSSRKIRNLATTPITGERSEVELEGRAVRGAMSSALLQIRGAARISLAMGTATALFALSDALSSGLERGLPPALSCFLLGGVGAGLAGHFGRVAKEQRARFRDEWNARGRRPHAM